MEITFLGIFALLLIVYVIFKVIQSFIKWVIIIALLVFALIYFNVDEKDINKIKKQTNNVINCNY